MAALFLLVMGGLYGGIFTPNEAAGIGAAGAVLIGLIRRNLTMKGFNKALIDTIKVTSMIFIILIGAMLFNRFLVLTTIPTALAAFISGLEMSPMITVGIMFVLYLILGCFFDTAAITLLTIPIFFPVIVALKIDPIWFGVFFCICHGDGDAHAAGGYELLCHCGCLQAAIKRCLPGNHSFSHTHGGHHSPADDLSEACALFTQFNDWMMKLGN